MKVFIDTGAFIAYFIKREPFHQEVSKRYHFYRGQKATLITSNYIIDELLTWFIRHQNKSITQKLVDYLEGSVANGELRVSYIDQVIDKKALEIFLKFAEHKISFTDATTYVLYKDFAIDEIFTLDADFRRMRLRTSF